MKESFHSAITQAVVYLMAVLLLIGFSGTGFHTYAAAVDERESTILRVAFPQSPGISEIDSYGNYSGLLVDYLNEIAKYTNWQYEYIPVNLDNLYNDFQEGKFDLMGGIFYSPEYEDIFAYPRYSMGSSYATLLSRKEDNLIKSYDLQSLDGKTIGVIEQAKEKTHRLKEFLSANDLDCSIKYYSSTDMRKYNNLYPFLKNGEVDLILGNDSDIDENFQVAAYFNAQPYYIVTTAGNDEILNGLNMALERILDSEPGFAEEQYAYRFPNVKWSNPHLSDDELSYIASSPALTVAIPDNWPLFFCNDSSNGSRNGLLPQLFKKITDYTGLTFTYVLADTYADAIHMVQDGEADILGFFLDCGEAAHCEGLTLSKKYAQLNNIIVKNKRVDFPADGLTGAILSGTSLPFHIQADDIRHFTTVKEALEAVNQGEADFFYGLSAQIDRQIQLNRYVNLAPITWLNENSSISFAMTAPINPNLLSVLNKAISSIPADELSAILDHNLVSMGYTNLSFSEMIYANPVAFILLFSVFLLLLVAVILVVNHSRVKNALMLGELEKAQSKSKAKSEFLSQMSHELRTPMNAIIGLTDLVCLERGLTTRAKEKVEMIRTSSRYLTSLINDILDMSKIENGKLKIETVGFSLTDVLDGLQSMLESQAVQKQLIFRINREISHQNLTGDPIRLRQVLTNLLYNSIKFTPPGGSVFLTVREIDYNEQYAEFQFSVWDTGIGIAPEFQEQIFNSFEQLGRPSETNAGTGLGLPISKNIIEAMGGRLSLKSTPNEGSEFFFTLRFSLEMHNEPISAKPQPSVLDKVRILLTEDNNLNAEIARDLLEIRGAEIDRASNGKEAVELFNASSPGWYQCILMDIRMPIMDGLKASKAIRSGSHPDSKTIPIIAMTANSFQEDKIAALDAGMNAFIAKPVNIDSLVTVLLEKIV